MGVTIGHKLCIEAPYAALVLDRAEEMARAIRLDSGSVGIRRLHPRALSIDIPGCETLCFNFQTPAEIRAEKKRRGWSYAWEVLTGSGKRGLPPGYKIKQFPQNTRLYSADFCKTQFSEDPACHALVAELVRCVASRCLSAEIDDDGGYYYSGDAREAAAAIAQCGAMISALGGALRDAGFDVVSGAEISEPE